MKIWCTCSKKPVANAVKGVFLTNEFLESVIEAESKVALFIQTSVLDPGSGSHNVLKKLNVTHSAVRA